MSRSSPLPIAALPRSSTPSLIIAHTPHAYAAAAHLLEQPRTSLRTRLRVSEEMRGYFDNCRPPTTRIQISTLSQITTLFHTLHTFFRTRVRVSDDLCRGFENVQR
ncbi:hypothetical protein R3P38DRAFT_3167916 [Favolaschia claudopus]|uniref:Uncharacterized protein n=1 Tax=Favolaschia claudopus TaxID=2862362 RepID=A0AAW0E2I2_9AGAR